MLRLAGFFLCLLVLANSARADEGPAIEDYGKYPDIEMARLSPSGDKFAYVGAAGDQRKLFVYSTGGEPLSVLNLGAFKARALKWAGEDHVLVSLSSTQRPLAYNSRPAFEIGQVYAFNVKTKHGFWVFAEGVRKVAQAVLGEYGISHEGEKWFGYFGGINFGVGDRYLYRVDLDTGEVSKIGTPSPISDTDWIVDASGRIVAVSDFRDHRWKVFAVRSDGGRVLLTENDDDPYYFSSLLGLGRTQGTIVYQTVTHEDEVHTYELDLSNPSQSVELFAGEQLAGLIFDKQTGLLVGASLYREGLDVMLFEAVRQEQYESIKRALNGGWPTLQSWSQDFRRLIVYTNGGQDSGTYWLVDMATHKADPIGYERPTIGPDGVGETRMLHYKAADGLALEAILTLPPHRSETHLPVIVMPHGGPGDRNFLGFDWWAQAYASRGYAVLQPNYRGSDGYGNAFRKAGYGEWGRKMQSDIADALSAAAADNIVDPTRACIVGGSFGGYQALVSVTIRKEPYRCAVSYAGLTDLNNMLGYALYASVANPNALIIRHELGLDNKDATYSSNLLTPISPIKWAKNASAPILLIHGKDDTVVPYTQSVRMREALEQADKSVEMVTLPGEDHWLSYAPQRIEMLKASIVFIEKYNPPDSADAH